MNKFMWVQEKKNIISLWTYLAETKSQSLLTNNESFIISNVHQLYKKKFAQGNWIIYETVDPVVLNFICQSVVC